VGHRLETQPLVQASNVVAGVDLVLDPLLVELCESRIQREHVQVELLAQVTQVLEEAELQLPEALAVLLEFAQLELLIGEQLLVLVGQRAEHHQFFGVGVALVEHSSYELRQLDVPGVVVLLAPDMLASRELAVQRLQGEIEREVAFGQRLFTFVEQLVIAKEHGHCDLQEDLGGREDLGHLFALQRRQEAVKLGSSALHEGLQLSLLLEQLEQRRCSVFVLTLGEHLLRAHSPGS